MSEPVQHSLQISLNSAIKDIKSDNGITSEMEEAHAKRYRMKELELTLQVLEERQNLGSVTDCSRVDMYSPVDIYSPAEVSENFSSSVIGQPYSLLCCRNVDSRDRSLP